ncbi:N-alpha-acetyltransferase 30-like isoform X2 [Neoarius graeffei]|uniref:N-alpha-acetyltransferase 30-like isoform X2 n=1 Tax=Neoarius graeffei TaxID=443677 RepID=UPI00298D4C2C|nr:N-alpha-acetyltransferase 30-like isoform X2 [Neoarius graeffei]
MAVIPTHRFPAVRRAALWRFIRMAAVPTGPGSGSREEMISFPGNGCPVLGELENLGRKLQDLVVAPTGQKPHVCGCKVGRGNTRDYPFLELNHQCETFERRINGLNCVGVSGFIHKHKEDESLNGLKVAVEHWDRSSCVQNTSNPEHKLGLPYQGMNKSIVTLSRTEASQSHANTGYDLGTKVTKCYLRTDQGPEVTSQTVSAADGPVLEMCRLDLNRSPATEPNQSQDVVYVHYESELQMPGIMRLITKDLSEPYSIYTYRYFIHNWPQLCFLAMVQEVCVGAIVCKLDMHKKLFRRGYIAMLAVDSKHRRKNIGTNLVKKAIYAMVEGDCDEVVLETEITNKSALKLYENLGFVRDKRLFRYYLNVSG